MSSIPKTNKMLSQVWRGRCAVTDRRIGGNTGLLLTRWVASEKPTVFNLVLLTPHLVDALAEIGHQAFAPEAVDAITSRLAWAKAMYCMI